MGYYLRAVYVNKKQMRISVNIILYVVLASCGYSQSSYNFSKEDYVVLNVFLEQKPHFYLDSSVKSRNNSDSILFVKAYENKVNLYNSFKKSCSDKLNESKTLDYETNSLCSLADTFKVYEHLFSKNEIIYFSSALQRNEGNYVIDYDSILVSDIRPKEQKVDRENLSIKIDGIFYNHEKNKVVIKYWINERSLFHVLKKENGWWKNITNF